MTDTLGPALEHIECLVVLDIVRRALQVSGVVPLSMSEKERRAQIESLTDQDRAGLSDLDGAFYDAVGECMSQCEAFVVSHQADFAV